MKLKATVLAAVESSWCNFIIELRELPPSSYNKDDDDDYQNRTEKAYSGCDLKGCCVVAYFQSIYLEFESVELGDQLGVVECFGIFESFPVYLPNN